MPDVDDDEGGFLVEEVFFKAAWRSGTCCADAAPLMADVEVGVLFLHLILNQRHITLSLKPPG